MKKLYLVLVLLSIFFSGTVFGFPVYLYDFTGADAEVLMEITGNGTDSITFDVQVINPDNADLRGIWFNFDPFPLVPANLTVTGSDVTDYSFIIDGVVDLGGGATINPEGPFDAGVEIGLSGVGGGDYFHSTSFSVGYTEAIYLGGDFGARLTSVGVDGEDSSKLVGTAAPVPEPATIILIGTGLLGLAGVSRKKTKKNTASV